VSVDQGIASFLGLMRQARAPLPQVVLEDGTRTYLATRYADVRRLLPHTQFSRSIASAARGAPGPALAMSVTEMDPPMHTRIRRLVAGAFTARRIERLRPRIKQIARALLDGMIAAGPPADLVSRYAAPLTFEAQCEVLGVPAPYRGTIRAWSVARSGQPGATPEKTQAAELRLHACVTQVLMDKRCRPSGGLFDQLIAARDQHGLIDETELRGIAASLFFDGHFLTAMQIANSVLCLLESPDALRLLSADPGLISRAVEELVRLHPAVNHSMPRVATADLELGDMTIRAGEAVTAALPLANRDDAVFTQSDQLSLSRPANRHLSFGHGIHYCLGAHLARVELQVALTVLLQRLPGLRLAVPSIGLDWFVTQGARGVQALPVCW